MPNNKTKEKLKLWSNWLIGIGLAVSINILFEWQFNYDFFKRPFPNLVATNPTTAVIFILITVTFYLFNSKKNLNLKRISGSILLLIAFIISLLKVASFIQYFDLEIDKILFHEKLENEIGQLVSNRMSFITAVNFMIISSSLFLLNYEKTKKWNWPINLILLVGVISLFFILGYTYQAKEFRQVLFHFPMSVTTSASFIIVSAGILLAYPEKGFMQRFTVNWSGSTTAKILIPVAIIVPITFGMILLLFEWSNVFSIELGTTLMVISGIIIIFTFIWYTTGLLNKNDISRESAENQLRILNENLELRVADRTRQLENTIKDLEDYKVALDASSIIAITDEKGIIQYANDNFCKISKYSQEELIGRDHRIVNSGYHSKEFINNLWKTISSGKIWKGEFKNRAKDGSIYWVDTTIFPFVNEKGRPYKYLAIRADITQRVLSHEKLKASEENYRSLFENTIVAMYTTDMRTLKTIMVNNVGASLFGYRSENDFLERFDSSIHFLNEKDRLNNIETINEKGEMEDKILQMKKLDGTYFWAKLFVKLNSTKDRAQTVIIDITKEVEARKKLDDKIKELQEVNNELETFNFISNHDLQEPLRKIQNFASVLIKKEKTNISEEGQYYLERMTATSQQMRSIIDDLSAYSRIRKANQDFEKTDLNKITEEVISEFKEIITEKRAEIKSDVLCYANVIPYQFHQLFYNLISNSLKFTHPERAPRITIQSEIDYGNKLNNANLIPDIKYCHIIFRDNGIGFDHRYNERIFEIFERLHEHAKYQGSGIGLAMCKRILENHKGFITANGELNKGAQFDIYIPTEQKIESSSV